MIDVKTPVTFKGWDRDVRDELEIAELERTVNFENCTGVVLAVESGQLVVEWKCAEYVFRSFHFTDELEEIVPEEEIVEIDWDSSKVKVQWLKDQGYKYFSGEKESYFLDGKGNKWTVDQVGERYNTFVISQLIYPRLAILCSSDGDFAREENGVGFNKLDTVPGHSLVDWYRDKGFWTTGQLLFAIKIQHKYKNQLKRAMGRQYRDITTWRGIKILNKATGEFEAFPEGMLDSVKEETKEEVKETTKAED